MKQNDDMAFQDSSSDDLEANHDAPMQQPRLWRDQGWTARVIKNDDDEGWAVAMFLDGQPEPALVGPWTMGRDKKNPKPLDGPAFSTLVKTASEVIRRHEQHLQAQLHKSVLVEVAGGVVQVTLDIVPDDDDPSALLRARDADDLELAVVRVTPSFKLNMATARTWIEAGFPRLS